MRVRYIGPDESRDLAVPGGVIVCPRMKWVDVTKTAAETGIAEGHAEIAARDIVKLDGWELESTVKAKKTRAKKARAKKTTDSEPASPADEPELEPPATAQEQIIQDEEQQ